jgi:hypothetical protein
MAEREDDAHERPSLNERLWDLFVYIPAGAAVSAVEELPRLASKGREHLGIRVRSARAVGQVTVRAARSELRRRSGGLVGRGSTPAPPVRRGTEAAAPPGPTASDHRPPSPPYRNGHVPPVSTLAIPGFDTLSASQVVQRLDGLNRSELVSVRAYEASTRGRRTILSRVDQLLDERS